MASHEVNVCFEQRLGRDLLVTCPQFGDVKVSQRSADLSACGFLGGMARLFARVTAFLPLTMVFFPGFWAAWACCVAGAAA
jgi:hypothetical protein